MNKLKIVAEVLGYKEYSPDNRSKFSIHVYSKISINELEQFDPEIFSHQLIECEDYLLDKGWELSKPNYFLWKKRLERPQDYATTLGKTRAEAAINAIVEMNGGLG